MEPDEIQRDLETLPPDQEHALAELLRKKAEETERAARAKTAAGVLARIDAGKRVFYRTPAFRWSIASLLLFVAVDGVLFHAGWYNQYLQPNSSAGQVEGHMSWLKRYPHGAMPEVMVIGDSRIAEGFSARGAAHKTGDKFHFWNFGIGGATPRAWYYMLRDGDPTRRRFAAIVIPLDRYTDQDRGDGEGNRVTDLNFLAGRLRFADCPEFALSMLPAEYKIRALSGCLFRGIPFRLDVEELLQHVRTRVRAAREFRRNGVIYVDDYGGHPENLLGLTADFEHRTIHFPAGVDEARKQTVQATVMSVAVPQTGNWVNYRDHWFGKILDLYNDSPTRIIFFELPRGPIPPPQPSGFPETFPAWVRARSKAVVIPSGTFYFLESPELYFDGLHLNKAGRGLFTESLADLVARAGFTSGKPPAAPALLQAHFPAAK